MKTLILTLWTLMMSHSVFGQTTMVIHKTNGEKDTLATSAVEKITFFKSVTDIDGNIYHVVQIGNQLWTVENLKTTKYNDGTAIPNVTDNTEWTTTTDGAYCAYNNDENNVDTYGYLYNWYAVNTGKLAPAGWRVPSDEDWKMLEKHLGMSESEANSTGWRGADQGGKLKEAGTGHWQNPNTGATNSSGFTALPGGDRNNNTGTFFSLGYYGHWWSSNADGSYAWDRGLRYDFSDLDRYNVSQSYGFSVRLVRDVE